MSRRALSISFGFLALAFSSTALAQSSAPIAPKATMTDEAACTAGDGDACYRHGLSLTRADPPASQRLFEKGCDLCSGHACQSAAAGYRGIFDTKAKDDAKAKARQTKAVQCFVASCEAGSYHACFASSGVVAMGNGVPADEARSKELSARGAKLADAACNTGDATACLLRAADQMVTAPEQSVSFLAKGCTAGNQDACKTLQMACAAEHKGHAACPKVKQN